MPDTSRTSLSRTVRVDRSTSLGLAAALLALGSWVSLEAQTPSAASVPASPSAAAGMTTGLPRGATARDMQMMQVRTAAQAAQGEAVAASMARSANRTIDDQNHDRVLQDEREVKAIKREMAERMKWDRVNSRVNKVSANQMSTWNQGGGVRVERNVPDPFLMALIEEERIAAQREAQPKKSGFNPLKDVGRAVSKPFEGVSPPRAPGLTAPQQSNFDTAEDASGGGFFKNIRPPRIPIGNNGRSAPQAPAPAGAANAEPQFVSTSSGGARPSPQTANLAPTKPGSVPRISGAELVDGSSPVAHGSSQGASPSAPQTVSFADELPDTEKEKSGGLFSKLGSGGGSSSGGGLFSFGKKKSSPEVGTIDASLFPDQAVTQAPTGGSLGGGYTADDVAEDVASAPSSTGNVMLPGEAAPQQRSSGFSLSKPNISIPSLTRSSGGGGGRSVPTTTTINSSGTDIYVVTATAQFMVYGADRMQSEVRALPAGTVVRMTKPGEQYASVQVPGGPEGIVENKFLRPAQAGDTGGQFAPSN